ncbi:MAG: 2-phosphosulfolactate phosphatase [Symbiobacteriia bacterium]
MRIDVYPTAGSAVGADFASWAVAAIDVLRATSTMVTALAHGAVDILPVATPAEARTLSRGWPAASYVLGGERGALALPGFHLGNSPREYTPVQVAGRRVVMTTTNGTQALLAAQGAASLTAACFLNGRAVTRDLLRQGRDVAIICAGTHGQFDLVDAVCAGLIVDSLAGPQVPTEINDLGVAARDLYLGYRGRLAELMQQSRHGQRLLALGFADDLVYCAQEDALPLVPHWEAGRLVVSPS